MINNDGISLGPVALNPANALAESCARIRHEELRHQLAPIPPSDRKAESTYNRIVLDPVRLAPSSHDPLVVARNEDDLVHTRRLEFVKVVDVRRDVRDLASRLVGNVSYL
jgi:hypothetical protein